MGEGHGCTSYGPLVVGLGSQHIRGWGRRESFLEYAPKRSTSAEGMYIPRYLLYIR